MASSKQNIELECQQVQEQLLKLTSDREFLQREFERISSCSQNLLQQFHEDSNSQASDTKRSSYEIEKQKLEEKLKALETDIMEKDQRIEFLDSKASDYLLQVSTFSNSLFDNAEMNSEDVDSEGVGLASNKLVEEEQVETSKNIVDDDILSSCDEISSDNAQIPLETLSTSYELTGISNDGKVNVADEELNLNVEVKTVINLVMEEIPMEKASGESLEMSEACSKAILATNQVIENIQEQIENNDMYVSLEGDKPLQIDELEEKDSCSVGGISAEGSVEEKLDSAENVEINKIVGENSTLISTNGAIETSPQTIMDVQSGSKILDLAESASETNLPATAVNNANSTTDEAGKQSNGSGSPVREQMISLSSLVAELRRVKDDMGKCMTVKEQSFIDLEDQLQAANREVASLKTSMSVMSKNLEEKEQRYQALEEENIKKKTDIELKMKDVQEVTNKCSMLAEEKADILRKMEVLDIMMTEYRTEIEMLIAEKTKMEDQTKELLAAKAATSVAEAEIDSRTNVEEKEKEIEELVEKIQSMEKQMKELNDKLKVTNKHLKVMAREREHKQKECEVLKRKVEIVELKMCELQGTFDMLVKAVMVERDELIKEMEEKNGHIDEMHHSLSHLKEMHEQELEKVMKEKRAADEELSKYRSGELKAVAVIDRTEFDALACEKEKLANELKLKTEQKDLLEKKLKLMQDDMNDFVVTLKDEMARWKDESEKTKVEKKCMEETFASLQAEHLEMSAKYQMMDKSFQDLEKSNKEKTANLEVLKLQLEDLQQQLEDLNTKNFNLTSEMYSKEEEFREELSAREGTIQELNVTLTNNQKQSMENYNALQDDMTALQVKLKSSLEENKKQLKDMEDKLRQSQDEKKKEIAELQNKVQTLMEELKEAKSELAESQSTSYQECESASVSQDAELLSSSLAVAPSLPLDTVVDSSSTSHSLQTEAESREVENKVQLLEALRKREKELEESLEVMRKKLETKEAELQALVASDIPKLNEKIRELTGELKELKNKPAASESFKSQAEFEAVISKKEEKIRELDSKVNDLEQCLVNKNGYISQLEGRLEGNADSQNNVEMHLEQIRKLSADISSLKTELEETHEKCGTLKNTVEQLENDKQNFEQEKAKIIEDYESKLRNADGTLQEVCADLEEKKNSVERLESELRKCRNSHVEVVASLESSHIDRVAEVVHLHQRKADELKSYNSAKIYELHEHIDELYKEKKSLENQLSKLQKEHEVKLLKSIEKLEEEKNALQKDNEIIQKKVKILEEEKKQLEDEKDKLKNGFEKEQMMSADMQDQMVSDLEKLILSLESDKRDMEKEISQLKSLRDLQSSIILDNEKKLSLLGDEIVIANKENCILKDETKKLKSIIGDGTVSRYTGDLGKSEAVEELTERLKVLQNKLDDAENYIKEQEDIYAHKLNEEQDDHIMQLKALRNELTEEADIIELKRKQLSLDYEDKLALMAADYQDTLKETIRQYETRLSEEKSEFGRVLVSKIDEYERKLSLKTADVSTYEAQVNALQAELEDKCGVIEEMERNLDEMTLMKAALRAQVDDLKLTVTKIGEGEEKSSLEVLHSEYESRLKEIQDHYELQLSYLRSIFQGADFEVQADGTIEAQRECCSSPSLCSEYSIELSCLRPYLQGQSSPITELMADHQCHSSQGSEVDPSIDHSFHILARSASGIRSKEDPKLGITLSGLSAHLLAKSLSKGNGGDHLSNGTVTYTLTKSSSKSEVRSKLMALGGKCEPFICTSNPKLQSLMSSKETLQGNSTDFTGQPQLSAATSSSSIVKPDPSSLSTLGARPRPPRRSVTRIRSSPSVDPLAVVKGEGSSEAANHVGLHQPSDVSADSTHPNKYCAKTESPLCCVVQ